MTLRRYVFAYDASDPMAWVRRYLASDNPANHADAITDLPSDDATTRAEKRLARDAWARIYADATTSDPFSASKWAVADADALDADPNDTRVPERMRAFLSAPRPPSSASTFIHFANVELALGYLRRAHALSPQFINGLTTPAAQKNAIVDLWRNLASFFRAMNVRPWAWAKYRERVETQIGQWSGWNITHPVIGQSIHNTPRNEINPPLDAQGGLPRGLFIRRPTRLDVSAYARDTTRSDSDCGISVSEPQCATGAWRGDGAGAWRDAAIGRFQAIYGGDFNQNSLRVRFGTRDVIADGSRTEPGRSKLANACVNIGAEKDATTCTGATGDVHPVWITNAALLGGGVNYPLDPVEAGMAENHDCVARSIVNGMTDGPDLVRGPAGFNWCCGATSPPYSNTTLEMRAVTSPSGGKARTWWQPWLSYLPPMIWYDLLIWPLVQYLVSIDPLQLVYEMQIDALGKNMWTAIACGRDVAGLASVGIMDGQATLAKIRQRSATVAMVQGGATTIASLINPIAGAVVAMLSGVFSLVDENMVTDPLYKLDCFGRVEPAVETLSIEAAARPSDAPDVERMIALGAPPLAGVDAYEVPTAASVNQRVTITGMGTAVGRGSLAWVSDPSTIAAQAGGRSQSTGESSMKFAEPDEAIVRIVGMPQGGGVYLDGASTPIDGQWEAGTDATVWVVPVPYGTHSLAVRSPDGQVRAARVSLNSGQTLTGEFATMQPVVPEPPRGSAGMSGAAKAGVAVLAIGAIGGGAYIFRKKLGLESFFRGLTGKR
jgi:hypothetical protein